MKIEDLYCKNGNLNSAVLRRESFKNTDLYKQIIDKSILLGADEYSSFKERIHLFKENSLVPKCDYCESKAIFNKTSYNKHCGSRSCSSKHSSIKSINTKKIKYNGKGSSPLAIQKTKDRSIILNKKGRETLLNKYGVINASQLPNHLEKSRITLLKKYGVTHPSEIKINEFKRLEKTISFLQTLVSEKVIKCIDPIEEKQILYKNPCCQVKIECSIHGEELLPLETFKWRGRKFNKACSSCLRPYSNSSIAQNEILSWIESLGLLVKNNDRSIITPYEIDISIPEKKFGIEYHGLYWHSSSTNEKNDKYHLLKTELCKKAGWTLLQFFEDEWSFKREIVKSIIKTKLGLVNQKIYARKCKIVEITSSESKTFLDENHLQGSCNASVRIGLQNENGNLVMILTAGKSRFSRHEFEILRVCSIKNNLIVGGFSKLLKELKSKVNRNIISYVDLRYSNGLGYEKVGFKLIKQTPPGFFYTDKVIRKNRLEFQKHKLSKLNYYNPLLSDFENITNNGYRKIWDCGTLKYELKALIL